MKKIKLPIFIIALLFIFKSLMISSTINNPDDMSGAVQNIFSYIFIPISFKNIVITHHAPSIKSVPKEYVSDPVTSAYASNLEDFILEHQPMYWIHGHIHTPCQYNIGETKVICNPHGYIDEKDNGFIKELIIEL